MEAGTPTDGKPWRLAWFRALVGGSQTEASWMDRKRFPVRPRCPRFRLAPSKRSSESQAILHGFPSVASFPAEVSPRYFPRFPVRPRCPCFRLAPLKGSSLVRPRCPCFRLFCLAPSKRSSEPSYSPRFPIRPRFSRFRLAPSQRSFPKLFPTASCPSTMSTLLSRFLPTKLNPSFLSVHADHSLPAKLTP